MDKVDIKDRKQVLLDKAANYKKKIRTDVDDLYKDVENKGKKVLIMGAALLVTYGILDLILRTKSNNDYEEIEEGEIKNPPISTRPQQDSFIVRSIKEQIAAFIIAIAKQTLNEVLENLKNRKTESKQ